MPDFRTLKKMKTRDTTITILELSAAISHPMVADEPFLLVVKDPIRSSPVYNVIIATG